MSTIIHTENAPITRGHGNAQLAEPDDVVVLVDGVAVPILEINPIEGIIVLDDIDSDSDVRVHYHHTPNPTLEIDQLNSTAFRLNQWEHRSMMPHLYNSVLGPYEKPQPRQYEHRYQAFDYPYTSVLNDPTSMALNEPKHRITIPRFKRENNPFSLFFEGTEHPEDFEHIGPPLGPPQIENDLYIIDDVTSSKTVMEGQPHFFQRTLDLSFEHTSVLNFRTEIQEWEKTGDFSGVAAGYADTNRLYFVGLLEIGDFKTIGILSEEDESDWRSYRALEAVVSDTNVLSFDTQPPLTDGDEVFVEGDVYDVAEIEETSSAWLVHLTSALSVTGDVNVFPQVHWDNLNTYRVFRTQGGTTQVLVGGDILPYVRISEENAAISPDIFGIVDTNSLFFGSIDRKTTSRSGWDFYRYSLQPINQLDQDQVVVVNSNFQVLPEAEDPPWYLTDNQGYSTIFDNDFLLSQNVGQHHTGGGVTYTKIEPFLSSKAIVDLSTRLRVQSYATGIPAFFTIADDKREVTIGLFDEAAQFAGAGSLITKGFWAGATASTILTQGFAGGFGDIPEDQYFALFSGTHLFEDEGWVSTIDPDSFSFFDSHTRIVHDGGSVTAYYSDDEVPAPSNHVLNFRSKVRSFTPLLNGRLPVFWGTDDGEYQIHLMPYADPVDGSQHIVFCDEDGALILDGGDPVGFEFDWDDASYHSYKVSRFGANVTVFVDGVYQATFDATLLPPSTAAVGEVRTRLSLLDSQVNLDIDYLFAHSAHARQRLVGVHRGGSLLDTSNYEFVAREWFGTFLDIRVLRDPGNQTLVFVGDPDTPAFEYQYEELPERQDQRFNTNTELGYVQFGTSDPNTLSEVLWDYVRYKVVNRRDQQEANNKAIINRHNVITSGEPTIDEGPEEVLIEADGTNLIHLSKAGMYARTVLAVLDEDGTTTYPFTYDQESNTIVILGAGFPVENMIAKVIFYHSVPYGEEYLKNNWAYTRLNEDTPPVPLRQQVDLQASVSTEGSGDGEALLTKGFWNTGSGTTTLTQGQINDEVESFDEGSIAVTFTKNDEAFYQCLNVLESHDDGPLGLLSPACDESGITSLDIEGLFCSDGFSFPPQCGDGGTKPRYVGFFNDPNSVFNDIQTNTATPPRCFTATFIQDYEDEVPAPTDQALPNHPDSYMEDSYGVRHEFNSRFYTLARSSTTGDPVHTDSVVAVANEYDEDGLIIDVDFISPIYP